MIQLEVSGLSGYKGWRAYNVYHKLLLGLKMLPLYQHETYEDFFARIEEMPEEDQEKILREAVLFVDLELDEVLIMIGCIQDKNGIPYGPQQLKGMRPEEIFEALVSVAVKVSKIKINFVTKDEKKKLSV